MDTNTEGQSGWRHLDCSFESAGLGRCEWKGHDDWISPWRDAFLIFSFLIPAEKLGTADV
jgi:hypothetical protein